jgi:WD40 repeat protein
MKNKHHFSGIAIIIASLFFGGCCKPGRQGTGEFMSMEPHLEAITAVDFSPDDRILATGGVRGEKGTVILWDASTFERQMELPSNASRVNSVKFSPDGSILAVALSNETITLWSAKSKQELSTLRLGKSEAIKMAFSPDGKTLGMAGYENLVKLWDVNAQKPPASFGRRGGNWVTSLSFSPDGKFLATGGVDGKIRVWNLVINEVVAELDQKNNIDSLAFSPSGELLVAAGGRKDLLIWNLSSKKQERRLEPKSSVVDFAFSADGKILGTVLDTGLHGEGEIELWETITWRKVQVRGHTGTIYCIAFSPKRSIFVTGGGIDGTIKVWDYKTLLPADFYK